MKTQLSGEGYNAGKGGRKEEKKITSSKVDGASYSGNECTLGSLESIGWNRLLQRKPMWSLGVKNDRT